MSQSPLLILPHLSFETLFLYETFPEPPGPPASAGNSSSTATCNTRSVVLKVDPHQQWHYQGMCYKCIFLAPLNQKLGGGGWKVVSSPYEPRLEVTVMQECNETQSLDYTCSLCLSSPGNAEPFKGRNVFIFVFLMFGLVSTMWNKLAKSLLSEWIHALISPDFI